MDDHAGFRAMARALLEASDFDVVGEAADGASAIALSARLRPDWVLLDIQLPDIDGFVVRDRLALQIDPPAVLLTSTRSAASIGSRLRSDTTALFLPKDELSTTTIAALIRDR